MKNYMELLRRAKIFRGMEEKNILSMLDCLAAVKKRFTRGEFLYRAGEPAGMAALVLDGMFHIDREDYWGNNSILADVSAGELLGEVYSFLDDEPVRINAVAVKDSTVLLLDVKKIFQVCSTVCPYHAQLIRNFAYVLAVWNICRSGRHGINCFRIYPISRLSRILPVLKFRSTGSSWRIFWQWIEAPCPRNLEN